MKKYLLIPALLLLLISCDKKEIEVYSDTNYISFTKGMLDTTRLSFFFMRANVVDYPIEVNLIGKPLEKDAKYSVEIDSKTTTAPNYIYEMPKSFLFRNGLLKDTFYIRLTNAIELKEKSYIISYKIGDSEEIKSSGDIIGRSTITISDKAVKPDWWTTPEEIGYGSFESTYLGKYSDYKYELFIQVTDVIDMTDMQPSDMRMYSIIFKRWLKKQNPPIYDTANGENMQVSVVGE